MKQLFIIFIATCFIACTADEDESFKMSSCETSVVKETQEDAQEVANQVNQFILDKFSTNTRGVDGEELYPDFYGGSVVNEDGSLTILIPGDSASSVNAIKSITNSKLLRFKKMPIFFSNIK